MGRAAEPCAVPALITTLPAIRARTPQRRSDTCALSFDVRAVGAGVESRALSSGHGRKRNGVVGPRVFGVASLVLRGAGSSQLGAKIIEARAREVDLATVHWRAHLTCQVAEPGQGAPLLADIRYRDTEIGIDKMVTGGIAVDSTMTATEGPAGTPGRPPRRAAAAAPAARNGREGPKHWAGWPPRARMGPLARLLAGALRLLQAVRRGPTDLAVRNPVLLLLLLRAAEEVYRRILARRQYMTVADTAEDGRD
ncbi:unnamed protein product [Prorocentrum cordatum]|uniref:Peroxisomal membrane protein PEX16 n=1 Tax=Prorocentrum cordatum TaxID=2364126 RepID=A0ABN9T9E9_9DINO|nr:unnamed protein product [Polarella glacialis]